MGGAITGGVISGGVRTKLHQRYSTSLGRKNLIVRQLRGRGPDIARYEGSVILKYVSAKPANLPIATNRHYCIIADQCCWLWRPANGLQGDGLNVVQRELMLPIKGRSFQAAARLL